MLVLIYTIFGVIMALSVVPGELITTLPCRCGMYIGVAVTKPELIINPRAPERGSGKLSEDFE